ncbi:MAG TPA: FKBP-type peptidyl-prolyl cis-trans isomerase [Candidatus Sulfotelmatobacter sp.]|nr:FKBP-type peptidyl-prolyl cis-trans isomerase [Candidatus Sulfotelmatobacter sp.]
MTRLAVIAILLSTAVFVYAQTPAHKRTTTAHPATTGPTKVTGDGVKTPSGLQYWDIRLGTGQTAKEGDKVKVHYTGWLTTGKKFDSSVGAAPFEFTIGAGEVIKGWDEGVSGMKVGGKRQLRIPPELAYGEAGHPPQIPQKATLIFDVRLVSIAPKAAK